MQGEKMWTLNLSDIQGWKLSEWNLSDTGLVNVRHKVGKCPKCLRARRFILEFVQK